MHTWRNIRSLIDKQAQLPRSSGTLASRNIMGTQVSSLSQESIRWINHVAWARMGKSIIQERLLQAQARAILGYPHRPGGRENNKKGGRQNNKSHSPLISCPYPGHRVPPQGIAVKSKPVGGSRHPLPSLFPPRPRVFNIKNRSILFATQCSRLRHQDISNQP
jgi:hypothetical protein